MSVSRLRQNSGTSIPLSIVCIAMAVYSLSSTANVPLLFPTYTSRRMIASSYAASDLRRGRLVWNTAYARRVYSTGTPSRKHNAAASLRWCERAKTLHTAAWRALAAKWLGGDAS